MRKQLHHWIVGAMLALALPVFGQSSARPNVLLLLPDDLGVECLSSYGGTSHKTPNIDKLASPCR
jgi:arylsulfatase A